MRIAMIVPEKFLDEARKTAEAFDEEIIVRKDVEEVLRDLKTQQFNCVIARGSSEITLRNSDLNIPVISVPMTEIDILNSVREAERFSDRYSFLITENMEQPVRQYFTLTQRPARPVVVTRMEDIEENIQQILSDGTRVIIGGGMLKDYSEKYNFIPIFINSGAEAYIEAIHKAIEITSTMLKTEQSREFLMPSFPMTGTASWALTAKAASLWRTRPRTPCSGGRKARCRVCRPKRFRSSPAGVRATTITKMRSQKSETTKFS